MPITFRSRPKRFGLALIVTMAAISLAAIPGLQKGVPFVFLAVAVLVSTWFGGLGPGLLTIALSSVGAFGLLFLPLRSLTVTQWYDALGLGLFLLGGVFVCLMTAERDRARQYAKSHALRQEAVADLGTDALAGADSHSIVNQVPLLVAHILHVDCASIWEVLPDGDNLCFAAGHGWKDGTLRNTIISRRDFSQANYTLVTQTPVIVANLAKDDRFEAPRFQSDNRVVSGLTVLIPGLEKPFGVLGVFSIHPAKFTQDDIHFLQAIANVVANAIQQQELANSGTAWASLPGSVASRTG